jgi:hypothetical protein
LAEPDKFMLSLKDIPFLSSRMECWVFKHKYINEIGGLRADIESVIKACKELKESKEFVEFLTIILAVGNYLNSQGPKKNAYGFKLSSLKKLKETKTSDNSSNLEEYLVQYMKKEYPSTLEFYSTLSHISQAKRVAASLVKELMNMVKSGLSLLEKQIDLCTNSSMPSGDKFLSTFVPFQEKAENEYKIIVERNDKLEKELAEIAELFDEDKNSLVQKPEDFFSNLDSFITSWQTTRIQLEKKEEAKLKKSKPLPTVGPKKQAGLLNELSASMKNKKAYENRRSTRNNSFSDKSGTSGMFDNQ